MQAHRICARDTFATLLLTLVLALFGSALCAPTSHADETAASSGTSLASLSQILSDALADGIVATRQEAFLDESRAADFYFAQNGSGRCTITSVAMMTRRAAFLDGNPDWEDVDLASVTSDGWSAAGVKWNFTTAGYEIGIIDVDGTTDSLIRLLEEHPEGIAAYDPGVPHAVLLTDYDEESDTFFCADPAGYYSGARIPVAESWNGAVRGQSQEAVISGFSRAWVIV